VKNTLAFCLVLTLVMLGCGGGSGGLGEAGDGGGDPGSGAGQTDACKAMSTGVGASLNGFIPFTSQSRWNQDISASPVDPNSSAIINFIGPNIGLHPDFGAGQYQGSNMGIPYVVVGSSQNLAVINFTAYGDESDPGPMPVPSNAPIEGDPNPGNGDRHVIVLDNSTCFLYELYSSYPQPDGTWNAASTAVWDLTADEKRPWTWTSADAAGLSIFPGLVRYDEVAGGEIKHAIRFTLSQSRAAMVPPASHWAANSSDPSAPPMGMKLRLKSSFDVSGFPAQVQVILNAMKKYGLIMADNGSSMYISGAPDDHWDNDALHTLSQVKTSDFEVVQMDPVYTQSNMPQGSEPNIASFTASSADVNSGTAVALNWSVTGADYVILSPHIGAVRTTSVQVTPSATTTYTLYATNQYGRSTADVTVTVH
jgi:hypothetical protein